MKRVLLSLALILTPNILLAQSGRYFSAGGVFSGGTITAPILGPDGTALAPTYSFTNNTGTGMYLPNVNSLAFSVGQTTFLTIDALASQTILAGDVFAGGFFSADHIVSDELGFGGLTVSFSQCKFNTQQTPDTVTCSLGTTSRALVVIERGDENFDFAHANPTHPTIFVHSTTQNANEWISLGMQSTLIGQVTAGGNTDIMLGSQSNGDLFLVHNMSLATPGHKHWMRPTTLSLTEGSANQVVSAGVATDQGIGFEIFYTVFASDGTAQQARRGSINVAAVNEAATETCGINGSSETTDGSAIAATTGTLTYTWTCTTTPTNGILLNINPTSSLVQTSFFINYQVLYDSNFLQTIGP